MRFEKFGFRLAQEWEAWKALLLAPGKTTERYTRDEWNTAVREVSQDWFGEGVKNSDVADLFGAIGVIFNRLGLDVAGKKLAESDFGRALVVGVVATGVGVVAYEHAFGSGVDHVQAMGADHGNDSSSHSDTPITLINPIGAHHTDVDSSTKITVDPGTVGSDFEATGIVTNYGLKEVDRIAGQQYGSDMSDAQRSILDKVVGEVNRQSATGEILVLSPDTGIIQLQDTHREPVDSYDVERRGGMKYVVDEATNIVVGLSTDGQLFAVFGATPEGELTGLKTGDEALAISPLVWGEGDSSDMLGLYIDGKFYPIFDEEGKVNIPIKSNYPVKNAALMPAALDGYQSPDLINVTNRIDEMSNGALAVEDGGKIWDSATKAIIPGLSVDKNGKVWMELPSGERFKLKDGALSYDEATKEIKIRGYKLENGVWTESVDKVEQAVMEVLENPKYGIVAENYVIESGADGEVLVKEKETEKVVMISTEEGTRYDLGFAVDQIAAKSCESTDIKPRANDGLITPEMFVKMRNYFEILRHELNYYGGTNFFTNFLINRERQCWGQIGDGWSMIYRDGDGKGKKIDLIQVTMEEARAFANNR